MRSHWRGGGDIVSLAESIAALAPVILPRRVVRIITSRVELAPAGEVIRGIGKKRTPLLREIPVQNPETAVKPTEIDSPTSLPN